MAERKQTKNRTQNQNKKAPESKYKKDELIKNAKKAFGVAPEVVAGAIFNFKNDELTKKEAEEAIKKFLNRKVK